VPFENLSIHFGESIVLEPEALFAKIVERRRGGFCYELNGLFAVLLRAIGFDVTLLSAGVANPSGDFGPNFDHMALMVSLDQRWLVDVGFGDSFLDPLLMDVRDEQRPGRQGYRIASDGEDLTLMKRIDSAQVSDFAEWSPQYRFTLQPRQYSDYAEMCRYHQTSPQSHFTKARICTRATPEGRITLSEMRLIRTTLNGDRTETVVDTEAEFAVLLKQHSIIVHGAIAKRDSANTPKRWKPRRPHNVWCGNHAPLFVRRASPDDALGDAGTIDATGHADRFSGEIRRKRQRTRSQSV